MPPPPSTTAGGGTVEKSEFGFGAMARWGLLRMSKVRIGLISVAMGAMMGSKSFSGITLFRNGWTGFSGQEDSSPSFAIARRDEGGCHGIEQRAKTRADGELVRDGVREKRTGRSGKGGCWAWIASRMERASRMKRDDASRKGGQA